MSSQKRTLAFLGATGGTGAAALAAALSAGHHSTALVRDPSKLQTILTTQHSLSASTISTYLTTITGSAKSPSDIARALISPLNDKYLVDTIYTSLGSVPKPQFSLRQPLVLIDPTICEDGIATTFAALDELSSKGVKTTSSGKKPALVIVSGTTSRNIFSELPWAYLIYPLYTYLLSSPHEDKMAAEALLYADEQSHIRGFTIVRPSFLTEGKALGEEKLRVGWVWNDAEKETARGSAGEREKGRLVGWTVSKRDLGTWVAERVLAGGEGEESGWEGKVAKVTY